MGHTDVTDRYQSLARTPFGRLLVKNLGLPDPPRLERWTSGAPVVDGTVVLGGAAGGRLADPVQRQLKGLDVVTVGAVDSDQKAKALVFDATGIGDVAGLADLREFFTPLMRRLAPNSRALVLGTPPERASDPAAAVAQRALEGFTRSLAKELRAGGTAQLLYVAPGAEESLTSTLAPSRCSTRAIDAPIPRAAPVTSTTRPASGCCRSYGGIAPLPSVLSTRTTWPDTYAARGDSRNASVDVKDSSAPGAT